METRGKHAEYTRNLGGIHAEYMWKLRVKIAEVHTWKSRVIHMESRRKRRGWKFTLGKEAYNTRNPRGIDVEIRRKSSGSRQAEKMRIACVIHVE